MRWTEQDVRRVTARLQSAVSMPLAPVTSRVKCTKYHNIRVTFQGEKFDSQHELDTWKDFKAQELMGAIRSVVRQVSLPLPGSTRRIRIDFMIVENDEKIRWMDAKGYETAAWKCKRDQILTAYGIRVELV